MKTSVKLVLVFVFIIFSINSNAQWKQLDFTGGVIKKIVTIDDTIFALSSAGIYKSSDYGSNWIEVNNKEIIEKIDTINFTQFFVHGNIYSCNSKIYFCIRNRLLCSVDYGKSWTKMSSPYSTTGISYYSVNDSLIAYSTDSFVMYKWIDNQWEVIQQNKKHTQLFQTEPNSIFLFDNTNLNHPLLNSKDGEIFRPVYTRGLPIYDSVITDSGVSYFLNIKNFSGDNNYFFMVANDFKIYYKPTKELYNLKVNWTLISASFPIEIQYIYRIAYFDSVLYAIVTSKDNKSYCYRSTDLGTNWVSTNSCGILPQLKINNNYYSTSSNGVIISSDKGVTWRSLKRNIRAVDIFYVKSNKHRLFTFDYSNRKFLISDDKGESWNIPDGIDSIIYTYPSGLIFTDSIILVNCNSNYYKSYDNGSTWKLFNLSINASPVVGIYPTVANNFVLTTYNNISKAYRVYKSINLVNFVEISDYFPFNAAYLENLVSDSNYVYVAESYAYALYKSSNLTDWVKEYNPFKTSNKSIYKLYNFNNRIYACVDDGPFGADFKYFVKENNNWVELTYTGLGDRRRPQPIIQNNGVYFTMDKFSNKIYHSKDLQNWYLIDRSGLNSDVYIYEEASLTVLDSIVYIGTRNRGIFKSSIIVSSINSTKNNSILTISPTPANTTISIQSDFKTNAHYKIINVQGQLVQEGILNSTINVEALTSGLYFLQIFDKDSLGSGKFLKISQ